MRAPPQAVIDTLNFHQYAKKSRENTWVLEFYAPWCKHCQALEPVYKQAAEDVRTLRFGKIDATANKGLATRYGVTGYPTVKWMRDGWVRPYNGMRDSSGFQQLSDLLSAPPVAAIETANELELFRGMQPITFVLVSDSKLEEDRLAAATELGARSGQRFSRVARRLQDIGGFGQVSNAVAKSAGLPLPSEGLSVAEGRPAHLLRLEKGEEPLVYTAAFDKQSFEEPAADEKPEGDADLVSALVGKGDADDRAVAGMTKWVLGRQFPLVSDLNKNNFFDVSRGGRMVAAVVIDPSIGLGKESRKWREAFLTTVARPGSEGLTEEEREQFFFGVMDGTEEDADTYLESFGVFKKDLPQLIVFSFLDKADEFFYNEGFGKPEEVVGFVRGVANGTYTAQYEGSYGMPDRIWRGLKVYMPFIGALDFLPRFTFTVLLGLALVAFLVKCMCFDDDDWLEGPPQPTSETRRRNKEREEAVMRRNAENRKRVRLATTSAQTRAQSEISGGPVSPVVWCGCFASGWQEDAARFEREADAMEARQRIAAAKARGAESFAKAKAAEEEDNPAAEEEAKKDA